MILYISTKICENISKGFRVIEWTSYMKISKRVSKLLSGHDFQTEIFQGAQFRKNVGEVMVLVLSTSSENALYMYQVL